MKDLVAEDINNLLKKYAPQFADVVDFNRENESFIQLDFTANNIDLTAEIIEKTPLFCNYIANLLGDVNAKYGVGGYMEHRTVYARSQHFNSKDGEENRRLHLGVDIWGKAGTPVYSFMDATIHSYAFNDNFGDYGATIILEHQLENITFYSLYGHLSCENLKDIKVGNAIKKGNHFCDFGEPDDNGHWPPHLHFQLMIDMEGNMGDYPGVGKFSEKDLWLKKIPDANLVLKFINS